MANNMAELITVLNVNELVLEELALVLKEEERCIIAMDLDKLSENGCRKEAITARLIRVRNECCTLMGQAGNDLGLAEVPSLSPLIAASSSVEQRRLRPLQQRLTNLARTLEHQYAMNLRLLGNSLNLITRSMALFGSLLCSCDTYGARGEINRGRASGSFLRREI